MCTGEVLDQKNTLVDNKFAYHVAKYIAKSDNDDENIDPHSIAKCKSRVDWPMLNETIKAKLDSLMKHKVFGSIVQTSKGVKPMGYKWVFIRKK